MRAHVLPARGVFEALAAWRAGFRMGSEIGEIIFVQIMEMEMRNELCCEDQFENERIKQIS